MRIRFVAICAVLGVLFTLGGCASIEKQARDGIAAANGYITSARAQHPECDPRAHPENQPQTSCQVIRRTTEANNVAIDALETYCGGPAFDAGTGPCTPPAKNTSAYNSALNKLQSALNNLNQTASDIKKLAGK